MGEFAGDLITPLACTIVTLLFIYVRILRIMQETRRELKLSRTSTYTSSPLHFADLSMHYRLVPFRLRGDSLTGRFAHCLISPKLVLERPANTLRAYHGHIYRLLYLTGHGKTS